MMPIHENTCIVFKPDGTAVEASVWVRSDAYPLGSYRFIKPNKWDYLVLDETYSDKYWVPKPYHWIDISEVPPEYRAMALLLT